MHRIRPSIHSTVIQRALLVVCYVSAVAALAGVPIAAHAVSPGAIRISADANGDTHGGNASGARVSADGSIIVFTGTARLTASAPAGPWTTYAYDMRTHQFIWNSPGTPLYGTENGPETAAQNISADGRLVLVYSNVDMAHDGKAEGAFVYSLETGAAERVSVDGAGNQLPGMHDIEVEAIRMSANGRYIVSSANTSGTPNRQYSLWVYDMTTHTSQTIGNPYGNVMPRGISDDGRYVLYGQSNYPGHEFALYDRTAGQEVLAPVNLYAGSDAALLPDGSAIIYTAVPGQYAGQGNPPAHVFRMSVPDGSITDLTPSSDSGISSRTAGGMSPDGRFITMHSQLALAAGATAGSWNLYAYDLTTGVATFIDANANEWNGADVPNDAGIVAFSTMSLSNANVLESYALPLNGWTPPAPVWTPQPWDNTPPDLTPPMLSANFDPNAWYNDPTVTFTCIDPGVGEITPPAPQTFTAEGYNYFSASCTDAQGNVATGDWVIGVDHTLPVVQDGATAVTSKAGAAFAATMLVYDGGSGVAAASCTIADGTLLPVGTYTMQCSGSDKAGNTVSGSATLTVEPRQQDTLSASTLGTKTRNTTANDVSHVALTADTHYGDTLVLAANIGSGAGTVKCKDGRGNDYQKVTDRQTATGRLIVCAGAMDTPLLAGETVTITYPSYDGTSAVSVAALHGLDTPGTYVDRSARDGVISAVTTGKAIPTGTRFAVFGAVAYDGAASFTPNDFWSPLSGPVSAGKNAKMRTILPVYRLVQGGPDSWYRLDGTLSAASPWEASISIWTAQNSTIPQ